jgi:hypothetical protein
LRFAAAAAEITELPPGPDRDLVAKVCQSCHDLQMVFDAAGISRQEWDMWLEENDRQRRERFGGRSVKDRCLSLELSGSLPAQSHDRPLIDGRL